MGPLFFVFSAIAERAAVPLFAVSACLPWHLSRAPSLSLSLPLSLLFFFVLCPVVLFRHRGGLQILSAFSPFLACFSLPVLVGACLLLRPFSFSLAYFRLMLRCSAVLVADGSPLLSLFRIGPFVWVGCAGLPFLWGFCLVIASLPFDASCVASPNGWCFLLSALSHFSFALPFPLLCSSSIPVCIRDGCRSAGRSLLLPRGSIGSGPATLRTIVLNWGGWLPVLCVGVFSWCGLLPFWRRAVCVLLRLPLSVSCPTVSAPLFWDCASSFGAWIFFAGRFPFHVFVPAFDLS